MSEASDALRRVLKQAKVYSIVAEVVSVDDAARTCTVQPINDDPELDEIRLQVDMDAKVGLYVKPVVGSNVAVTFLDNCDGFVSLYSEIEKVELVVGEAKIEVKDGNVLFNHGSLGGMVKVDPLVTALSNLQEDVNSLKTIVSGWAPLANDGGAALKTALSDWYAQSLTVTAKNDIENPKIKH